MKIFLMSDIHSNLEALEEVLKQQEQENSDLHVVLGDITGYGPDPTLCIQKVVSLPNLRAVMGNHDKVVAGLVAPLHFNKHAIVSSFLNRKRLGKVEEEWLAALPESLNISNEIAIFHGSPLSHDEYLLTPSNALASFQHLTKVGIKLGFFGHTHLPTLFEYDENTDDVKDFPLKTVRNFSLALDAGKRYLFNPGSVGQPRDGNPHASFAVVEIVGNDAHFKLSRVKYPVEECQRKMTEGSFPEPLINRLEFGF
ncbi:MAG: metallophosphoesterase family protein [Candidatus Riflebacteria bacterium]|nr:metallophosphoesterase family protein [Candidatus Riflebacteria bacterium]